jgi:hypothetical protein
MQMEAGLDSGPVLLCERSRSTSRRYGIGAHRPSRLARRRLIVDALARLPLPPQAQAETGATYAAKIDKAEARSTGVCRPRSWPARCQSLQPFSRSFLRGRRHSAQGLARRGRSPAMAALARFSLPTAKWHRRCLWRRRSAARGASESRRQASAGGTVPGREHLLWRVRGVLCPHLSTGLDQWRQRARAGVACLKSALLGTPELPTNCLVHCCFLGGFCNAR